MKKLHALATAALAIVLGGCAGIYPGAVPEAQRSAIRTVAVASGLGPQLHGISIGTTVFQNRSWKADVAAWAVDASVVDHVATALQGAGRYTVVRLPPDGTVFDEAELPDAVLNAARQQGADTLVAVEPSPSDNHPFYAAGFGLFERSFLGSAKRCAYGMYVVTVTDLATRRRLAFEWVHGGPCNMGTDDDVPFRPSFAEYSAEEQALIRQRVEKRLRESLTSTLENLALVARPASSS